MKRNWELDELIEHFTFLQNEMQQIGNKSGETRIGFAVMFKFFQYEARFPFYKFEAPKAVISYIAKQIEVPAELYAQYDWNGRMIKYHRAQIREFFGFREDTVQDAQEMSVWLSQHVLHQSQEWEHVKVAVYGRFRELKVEPPSPDRVERLIRSAIHTHEEKFFQATFLKLPPSTPAKLDALIESIAMLDDIGEDPPIDDNGQVTFHELKTDPGRPGLESVMKEVHKLRALRHLELPDGLFRDTPHKVLKKYRQRVSTEDIRELRRHPDPIRLRCYAHSSGFEVRRSQITSWTCWCRLFIGSAFAPNGK